MNLSRNSGGSRAYSNDHKTTFVLSRCESARIKFACISPADVDRLWLLNFPYQVNSNNPFLFWLSLICLRYYNLTSMFHSNNFIYNFHSSGNANVENDCPGSYYENGNVEFNIIIQWLFYIHEDLWWAINS